MDFAEFSERLSMSTTPVILLEGTRELLAEDRPKLVALAAGLATAFPPAIFRTGNAEGADEAFAEGISHIDPARLQYVLPYDSWRKGKRNPASYSAAIENAPRAEQLQLIEKTNQATPRNAPLMAFYAQGIRNSAYAKARYLLRDTLKVVGSPGLGLRPATIGVFYVNSQSPGSGGTGHTMRVCERNDVPVIVQAEWMKW